MKKNTFCLMLIAFLMTNIPLRSQDHTLAPLIWLLSAQSDLQMEALIMDPVYDYNHKITGYSMGGMVKVEYLPYGATYPERKVTSLWNPTRIKWLEVRISSYEYDDQMRVLSETVEILDQTWHRELVMKDAFKKEYQYEKESDKERVLVKLTKFSDSIVIEEVLEEDIEEIAQENRANIEWGLEEYEEVVKMEEYEMEVYEISSETDAENTSAVSPVYSYILYNEIRYLNDFQLPDSVTYFFQDKESVKMKYKYDDEQRISAISIFHREDDLYAIDKYTFEESFNIQVTYIGNKVTYSHNASEAFIKAYEEIERELGDRTYLHPTWPLYTLYKGPLNFSFTFDKNKRLTSKNINLNDKTLLTAHYKYYPRVAKNATTEINTLDMSYLVSGLFPMETLTEMKDMHKMSYKVKYDKNGFRTFEVFMQKEVSGKKVKIATITDRYTYDGKLMCHDFVKYDPDNGKFDERDLVTIMYGIEEDGTNWTEEAKFFAVKDEKDIYKSAYSKELVKRDAQDRVIYKEYNYNYDRDTGYWEAGRINRTKYNENGYEDLEETTYYNDEKGTRKSGKQKSYVKNPDGQITYMVLSEWKNGDWKPTNKCQYAYDKSGNKVGQEEYYIESDKWRGYNKKEWEYDSLGNVTLNISYKWDKASVKWYPTEKEEKTHDKYGYEEVNYNWKSGEWLPEVKYYISNKTNFPKEKILNKWKWISEKEEWRVEQLLKEYEADEDTSVKELYVWDDDWEQVIGQKYEITAFTDNLEIVTYHAWHMEKEEWEKFLRFSKKETGYWNKDIYIVELYDPLAESWVNEEKMEVLAVPAIEKGEERTLIHKTTYKWLKENKEWKKSSYLQECRSHYNETPLKAECFNYDLQSGDSIQFAFLLTDKANKENDGDIYYVWNVDKASYEPFYKKGNYDNYWNSIDETWENVHLIKDVKKKEELVRQGVILRRLFSLDSDTMIDSYFEKAPDHLLLFK